MPNPLSSPPRWCLWDLLRSFKSVQMLKREWGAESNGKLPHLSIPSKTTAWVSESAVEDLPLSRTAALVLELILQPCPRFTYVTAHSPTLPLLHLRHTSFFNPSFASLMSQDFHLRHLASRPWRAVRSLALNGSPGIMLR